MARNVLKLYIYFSFVFAILMSSCTRNPLGEVVSQSILNLGFTLSHNCTTSFPEYSSFSCQIQTSEPLTNLTWSLDPENTCSWAAINSSTGEITGTTSNANINGCNLVIRAQNQTRRSSPLTIAMSISNVAPTLTIGNASAINEDSLATVIRSDLDITSSEEAYGGNYSFDHPSTTLPRCFDNATVLSINSANGEISYAPSLNYFGTCNIRVVYNDGGGWPDSTVSAEFNVTVNPVNDAPVISAISNQVILEGNVLNFNFTMTDVDHSLNCSTSLSASSSNTTLIPVSGIVFGGVAPNCTATLTHSAFQDGVSNIVFTASDGLLTGTSSFTYTVVNVNDPPVISALSAQAMSEDNSIVVNFTINDTDSTLVCDSSYLSVSSSNVGLMPASAVVFSGTAPNCSATMTPSLNQNGTSNISIIVSDLEPIPATASSSFALTVNSVNDAPIISAISAQTASEDSTIAVNFTITDIDNSLNCGTSVSAMSSNTTLIPVSNIIFSGTAPNCIATVSSALNQNGNANITLTVTDGNLLDTESFAVTIFAVNDTPTISAISAQVMSEDSTLTVNFAIDDPDDILDCTTSISATSTNTTLLPLTGITFGGVAPNCNATLDSSLDQFGLTNIVLTVTDSGLLTATSNFNLTVNSVNDVPVISMIAAQTASQDNTVIVNFTITDVDHSLDCLSSLSATSTNTTLIPLSGIVFSGTAPNCTATLNHAFNQYGTSNIGIVANDGIDSVTRSFVYTIIQTNFVPTISYSGPYNLQAGQVVSPAITPTLGGSALTSCTVTPSLPLGLIIDNSTCVVSGTPANVTASQVYTVTATNVAGSASADFTLSVASSSASNITLTGSASFTTSSCAQFTITARDSFGNLADVIVNTTFNLSGAGTNGVFYTDSGCLTSTTTAVMLSGTSNASFYYRKSTAGSASLVANLASPLFPALGSATRGVNVSASTPARLQLIIAATGTTDTCNPITINVLDANNNLVNVVSNTTINLSGTGTPAFFSNSSCGTSASSLVIATGNNTGLIYMRKITVGTSNLTAASAGVGNGTGSIFISLAPSGRIRFSAVATQPYSVSTCQAYTLQSRDPLNNNTVNVTSDTLVTLSGVEDGSFYSNSSCTPGNQITTTTILSGTSARTVYYSKPTTTAVTPGANITLRASVVGWSPDATTSVNVSTGFPTHLATTNTAVGISILSATNVAIGSRCLLTTVRVHDEANALVPGSRVTAPIITSLSGGGAGAQFWSNATCTTPISTLTINTGSNTGNFYYSSTTTSPTVAINWTSGGLGGTGGSRNVTVSSGEPSRMTWTTAPTAFNTNTCQTFTFNIRDPNTVTSIGANVSTSTQFLLSDGSDGIFYSNAACTTVIPNITIASGAQVGTFYYRKATAGSVNVAVILQSPANPPITTLLRAVTVNSPAPVPNNVLITASPSAGLVANQSCSLLTLMSRNGGTAANVTADSTFTLSATNGGAFYYDSGCTAVASPATMTITNGSSSVSGIYVRGTNSGSVIVSGSGPLTVNNLNLNYSPTPPTMLVINGPVVLAAGISCGAYTVSSQDASGNLRNVLANTIISFANTGVQPVQFYSNSSCTTVIPGQQMTLSNGSNTLTFYVRGNNVGTAQIQTSAAGLTSATHAISLQ